MKVCMRSTCSKLLWESKLIRPLVVPCVHAASQYHKAADAGERPVDSRNQMRIEQGLDLVGCGVLLSSSQTTREEVWIDSLNELTSSYVDESLAFRVSRLSSLVHFNPLVFID
jgi:hypothetical protein